jgi:hypothetical protein
MTLVDYFYLSVSIAATLVSLAVLAWILIALWVILRIKQILVKVDKITESTTDMAQNIKAFVSVTTNRVANVERIFLTTSGIRQVAGFFAEAVHNFKRKQKGDDNYES